MAFLRTVIILVICFTAITVSGESSRRLAGKNNEPPPPANRRAETKDKVGAFWPVYVMYTTFVGDAVQLKRLNQLNETLNFKSFDTMFDNIGNEWNDWVIYFIGFAVCVAVGVVTFLVMLITALVLPCCRCCGKCGGKRDPEDKKKSHRQRVGCSISLFIFNCILVLGVLSLFFANDRLRDQLRGDGNVFDSIKQDINGIKPFLNKSVDDLNTTVLQKYENSTEVIFRTLKDVSTTVLTKLDEETKLLKAYSDLDKFSSNLDNLNITFTSITDNTNALDSNNTDLETELNGIKTSILPKLQGCTSNACSIAVNTTQDLNININFTSINVNSAKDAVESAIIGGFPNLVNDIENDLRSIKDNVNTTTYQEISKAEDTAEDIEKEIADVIADIQNAVSDLDLSQVDKYMDDAYDFVEDNNIADIIYWSIVGLSSTLCLIIFLNLVGLLHGAACSRAKPDSKCVDCTKAQASRWLLASSAFTFIFYWIYVLIVLVTFAVGGTLYTEVCRNAIYFNDAKSVKALDVLDRLANNSIKDMNVAIFDAYRQCERDKTIYTALRLAENGYNLSEMIDLKAVQDAVDDIKQLSINVPKIDIYDDKLALMLSNLTQVTQMDYQSMIRELQNELTTVNLNDLITKLEHTNVSSVNADINDLKELQEKIINNMENTKSIVAGDLESVMDTVQDLNFTELSIYLNNSESVINITGNELASSVVNDTAGMVMVNVTRLVDEIIYDAEENIAKCRPLYGTVTSLIDTVCTEAMMPINVLWFSLGWCLFFLIPFLILSFKLAKLFRKTIPYSEHVTTEVNFPEELLLQERPTATKKYDDLQPVDNFGFDPMEEYRKEIRQNQSHAHPLYGAQAMPPPPYAEAFRGFPRPSLNSHMPYVSEKPQHFSDGISSTNLKSRVPLDYVTDYSSSDGDLAHMY